MTLDLPVPLLQDYHRRFQYKTIGATYNGTTQTWSLMPRRDVRPVLTIAPEWVEHAEMLRRTILMRMIVDLDQGLNYA